MHDKSLSREYLEALLIAVIFATFARTFVVQAFKIPSGSMEENLLIGDHILVNKFVYGPTATALERRLLPVRPIRRGDVVVFRYPTKDPQEAPRDFIKRCMGLPGDTLEMIDKRLYINGREVHDESYVYHVDEEVLPRSPLLPRGLRGRDNFGPLTVPPASYFCMGDNRDNSNDSRFWGEVPAGNVRGRAFMIYWSFETPAESFEVPTPGERLRQLARLPLAFFSRTRWDRTFRVVR
jgi:signal peptidase I